MCSVTGSTHPRHVSDPGRQLCPTTEIVINICMIIRAESISKSGSTPTLLRSNTSFRITARPCTHASERFQLPGRWFIGRSSTWGLGVEPTGRNIRNIILLALVVSLVSVRWLSPTAPVPGGTASAGSRRVPAVLGGRSGTPGPPEDGLCRSVPSCPRSRTAATRHRDGARPERREAVSERSARLARE